MWCAELRKNVLLVLTVTVQNFPGFYNYASCQENDFSPKKF